MKTFVKYFLRGCLVLVPIAATAYVVYWVVERVDGMLGIPIPGVGFATTIAGVAIVGYLASNFIGRGAVGLVDRLLARLPLVRLLYNSLKDLLGTFVGERKAFDRPVLVTLSRESGVKALGFVTREGIRPAGLGEHVSVYFPQSYNFAGAMLLVPREDVQPLTGARSADFMAFIVSGGMSGSIEAG